MVKSQNWKIWNRDKNVEARTYQRLQKHIPEMESSKQLREIIKLIYFKKMRILDFGCASGHYYNSLEKIDKNIDYTGIDSTKDYINFGKKFFKSNKNVKLFKGDIFSLDKNFYKKFDITFCCNVLLHLPEIKKPIKNLLRSTKKYCIIRTLVSKKTHLSKYLYSDKFNNKNEPIDFVYQNTYSFDFIKKIIRSFGKYKINFLNDNFDNKKINNEYNKYKTKQQAVTKAINGIQYAGSKVFEWKWIIIRNV